MPGILSQACLLSATMLQSRSRLLLVLALVAVFVGGFVFLIHRHLIQLLQAIDQALSALGSGQAATPVATASMLEIRAVERAIGQLREVMQENEATREQLERLAITDSLTKQQGRNRVVTAPVGDATGETGRQPLNGDAPPSVDTAPS